MEIYVDFYSEFNTEIITVYDECKVSVEEENVRVAEQVLKRISECMISNGWIVVRKGGNQWHVINYLYIDLMCMWFICIFVF